MTIATVNRAPWSPESRTHHLVALLVAGSLALPAPARADDDEGEVGVPTSELSLSEDDLFVSEMELQERDTVFVATKTRKTLQEAPAIVTVMTADELRSGGYRTINEALATIPGFEHSSTSRWEFLFTRGNAFTIQVLLDGVPIVNPGDNLVFLDQAYPINLIKRIEVISGPGGILWGANAYLGVVNIVTKRGRDLNGAFVSAGGGSFRTARGAAGYGARFGDLEVLFMANAQTTDEGTVEVRRKSFLLPPEFAFPPDDLDPDNPTVYNADGPPLFQPGGETIPTSDYFVDFFGKVSWRNLTFTAKVPFEKDYYQQSSSTGALLGSSQSFDRDATRVLSLRYDERFLDDTLGVHAKAYWYSQDFQVDSVIFPSSQSTIPNPFAIQLKIADQRRIGANVEVNARLPFNNTLVGGAEYFRDEIEGATLGFFGPNSGSFIDMGELVPDSSSDVVSLYLNDEINLFERVAISGGVRYNHSSTYRDAVLGGAALVAHVLDHEAIQSYVKVSWAQGFRPPSFEQRFNTNPLFLGNLDISPERSNAGQVEVNAKLLHDVGPFEELNLRADFAHTILSGVIGLSANPNDPEGGAVFENIGRRQVNSVEAAASLAFDGGHSLNASYAFNDVRDLTERVDVDNNAQNMFNLGGRAQITKNVALHARYAFVGERSIPSYLDPTSLEEIRLDLPAYHLVSAGASLHDDEGRHELRIDAYNVLNQHYETLDGDVTAAPYPYAQPSQVAVMASISARL